jgi:hypothetical protein
MFRRLRTRLFAAALLLPLIAFATATGGHWLRCRVTGAMVEACCCGDEAEAAATPEATTTTVSESDCCDRVERQIAPSFAELTATETGAPDAAASALPFEDVSIDLVSAQPQTRATARSSLGPPTSRLRLIAKSTLLI